MNLLCRLFGHRMQTQHRTLLVRSNELHSVGTLFSQRRSACSRFFCNHADGWLKIKHSDRAFQSITLPMFQHDRLKEGRFIVFYGVGEGAILETEFDAHGH